MGLEKEEQDEQVVGNVENKTGQKAVMKTLKEAMKELSEEKIKEPAKNKAHIKKPEPAKLSKKKSQKQNAQNLSI
jgi:hypothetical protein